MSGEMVIVRGYKEAAYVRRLLEICDSAAFVCAPEEFQPIARGDQAAPVMGFPVRDVYWFDDAASAAISAGRSPDWRSLRAVSQ